MVQPPGHGVAAVRGLSRVRPQPAGQRRARRTDRKLIYLNKKKTPHQRFEAGAVLFWKVLPPAPWSRVLIYQSYGASVCTVVRLSSTDLNDLNNAPDLPPYTN